MGILTISPLDSYNIALTLSNLFTIYVAYKFFSVFTDESRNVLFTRICYTLYGIMIIFSSVVIDIPLVNLITTILFVSMIAFSYKINYSKALLLIAFYCSILFIGELLSAAITDRLFIQPLIKSEYENIFGLLLCKLGTFLAVLLLQNGKFYKGNQAPPVAYLLATIFTPTSSIVFGAMIMSIEGVTKRVVLISMAILILINILTFTLYDHLSIYYEKQIETATLKQENNYYHNQLNAMNYSVQETRAFRHDIQNHFNMIEGFLNADKIDSAVKYLHDLREADQLLEDNIVSTGNFVVDSVLNFKLSTIKDLKIDTDLEIFVPQNMNIDTVHFVSILTNLIDNAIEALRSIKTDKCKILRIRIVYTKGRLLILIQNSYDGDFVYKNGSISSSKDNSENHGYGLENVRKSLESYNGLLKINHEDGIFSVQALLYL